MIKGGNKLAFGVKLPNGNTPASSSKAPGVSINPAHTSAYQTTDFVVSTSQSAKLTKNMLAQPLNDPPRMSQPDGVDASPSIHRSNSVVN